MSDGPAIRLQAAAERARRLERASAADLAAFEADLDQLAADLTAIAADGRDDALIGFDRPATIYIASQVGPFTGTRAVLRALIRARPFERHIVLLTGGGPSGPAEDAVHEAGGFAVAPDPSLGLYDRWLWLSNKLDAYAAQRVVVLAEFSDVVARLGARQVAPGLRHRLYVVHADDRQPCPPGAALSSAVHLVLRAPLRRVLKEATPSLRVGTLFVPFEAERPVSRLSIPPSPIRGPGRRAAVRWSIQKARWTAAAIRTRARHLIAEGPWAEPLWKMRLARARLRRRSGEVVTATAGAEADFLTSGPLGFGTIIAGVLRASGGRHLHVGAAGPDFRRHAREGLAAADVDPVRLVFLDDVPLIGAFVSHRIDLLLGSFPRAGAGQAAAAAGTGLPFARYAEARAAGGPAPDALTWSTPAALFEGLRRVVAEGAAKPGFRARRRQAGDAARLGRRFGRIVDAIEGSLTRTVAGDSPAALVTPVFDAAHYAAQRPGAPAEPGAALAHYLATGAAAGASPCILFDPAHYLASLPPEARAAAAPDPLAHYLAAGERRGHPPHPMFDPVLCGKDLARARPHGGGGGPEAASVLARYLAGGWGVRPHMFFDPSHYAAQSHVHAQDHAPLADFLTEGLARGVGPHPLVEGEWLSQGRPASLPADLLAWLRGSLPQARQGHPLFDPGAITASDPEGRLGCAAPNLLWAHVIEGNLARRSPHLLIAPARVEEMRPGTLTDARTVVELIARDRLGRADAHPLVSSAHILAQAPWLPQLRRHPLRHFLDRAAADNIDPHPWFSTQFYLYQNPDVARLGANPLVHYLRSGATEGRWPNAFFNGNQYFRRYLVAEGGGQPLIDYVKRGAGLFWTTVMQDDALRRVSFPSVKAHFDLEVRLGASLAAAPPQAGSPLAPSGAAPLLRQILHHPTSAEHPTLLAESRRLLDATPEPGPDILSSRQVEPAARVTVHRPSIVAPRHIPASSGSYDVPAIDVGIYPDATVVAGNDGFLTATGLWLDHGLAGFDPAAMEPKENAAVFAVSGDRVLLRRHRAGAGLPSGIFCCGSYSRNYYHFLIETLPRALFAAEVAPPGTPRLEGGWGRLREQRPCPGQRVGLVASGAQGVEDARRVPRQDR